MTSARQSEWVAENRDRVRGYKRKYSEKNADNIREYQRLYALAFPEKTLARVKKYQKRHASRVAKQKIRYRANNIEKVRLAQNKWQAGKMSDLDFRIKKLLRGRTNIAIRAVNGAKKCAKTMEMLGCSIADFRIYIESKFESGMTWKNYGKVWHVDHIMPCAIFDLTKPDHQKRCFHFSNMQPLFVADNLKKNRWHFSDQFNLI